ncbi:hypothetical protein Bca4012_002857 [Brassica carinata]
MKQCCFPLSFSEEDNYAIGGSSSGNAPPKHIPFRRSPLLPFPCSFFFSISLLSCFLQNGVTPPRVFVSKKKKSKKDDSHSFSSRPDEATTRFLNPFFSKRKDEWFS